MTLTRNNRDKRSNAADAEADVVQLGVKVTELERELATAQQRLATARTRLHDTQSTLVDAQTALDRSESRHLAGRVSDAELAKAREAQVAAKRAHAVAVADVEDAE